MFSIKRRLSALIILVALVSAIVLTVSYSTISPIKNDWQSYISNVAERQSLLSAIKSQFGYGGAIHNFKNYVLRGSPQYYDRITENFSSLNDLIKQYSILQGISVEEKQALEAIKAVANKYSAATSVVKQLHSEGKTGQLIDQTVKIDDSPAIKAFTILAKIQTSLTQERTLRLESQIDFSQNMLFLTIAIAVILVLGIVIALSQSILKPLSTLQTVIQQAQEENNLSLKTELIGRDEISQIGQAFDNMMETFRQIIQNINRLANELSIEAGSLATITEQSGADITSQQSQTYQVAQSIHQINLAVNEMANNLASTATTSNETNQETIDGKNLLQKTIVSIQDLSQQIEKSTQVIHQLNSNSEKINSVVDVIRGIAEQTNLLALNAAIEAARAGEQGRGFAVVADEVRTLAGRTQESTEEINQMVSLLQSDTSRAVEVMNESSEQANFVVEQATLAGNSLDSISGSIAKINNQTNDVASVTTQQSEMLNSINKNIEQINEMSKQTSEGAKQSSSTSESLAQLANKLKHTTSKFQI